MLQGGHLVRRRLRAVQGADRDRAVGRRRRSASCAAPLGWPERIACGAGALLLVVAVPLTDEMGFAVGVLFLAFHFVKARRLERAA